MNEGMREKEGAAIVRAIGIPLREGLVATVPYPMSEADFDLLIGTLQLWKRNLVAPAAEERLEALRSGRWEEDQ